VKIQEINLESGNVLPNFRPPSPLEELEEEKKYSTPEDNSPPYLERLVQPKQHTLEEAKLLG